MTQQLTPTQAWSQMLEGNHRFVTGTPGHPHQDSERRHETVGSQFPHAALFGCADSRLAAEIIFDQGLGDLFVIRNAGQVTSPSVIGSLEYAVAILNVPLIVVLGHDSCGAVRAAIDSTAIDAPVLPPAVWRLIAPIVPSARKIEAETGTTAEDVSAELVGKLHLQSTVAELLHSSEVISDAVAAGRLAIVAANYRLADGTVDAHFTVGTATAAAA
ncbi:MULTISPECIES: carbonic anhydrase [Microbacterium]|uniref:carbonic anhydrase n=1 Tax=Microbacterium TaxID=33882 RepID=UPI0027E12E82|nr:carbonic anhydrase [Microbacterium nymphoidis]